MYYTMGQFLKNDFEIMHNNSAKFDTGLVDECDNSVTEYII